MGIRGLAALVLVTLVSWLATPAFASVACRPDVVRCSHCPKPKPSSTPAVKTDCCIITAAVDHPTAEPAHDGPPIALTEALDQALPAPQLAASAFGPRATLAPSPPFEKQNRPLLR